MINEISWLEYSKTILKKVSFDTTIFKKELLKSLIKLTKDEIIKLKNWCRQTFSNHLSVIASQMIDDYLVRSV